MTPTLKHVDTSLLRVGYEEWNPDGSRTVVLLHGWPDSIRCWSGVAPGLALAGWWAWATSRSAKRLLQCWPRYCIFSKHLLLRPTRCRVPQSRHKSKGHEAVRY